MKLHQKLLRDLPASIVVFLIALPLSLGIAKASGAEPIAGLIGAVVGGIVTGLLAGSPLQVSGPAAGLTVVVFGLVQELGWATVCVATACAGLVQLTLGFLKVARGTLVIAPSVVHGMLAGIGISIVCGQIHVLFGGNAASSVLQNLKALPEMLSKLNGDATLVGGVTFAVLVVWKMLPWAKLRAVPGPLVAVVVGTALSLILKLNVNKVELPETLGFTQLQLPSDWGIFIVAVLTLAIIASVESLLCAVATDKLHTGQRSNLDKELTAQGAGNLVSGLLGGLPITGVIVRSSANINAGGVSRLSAVFHGVWILLCMLFLGSMIQSIPYAVLAGLLIHVGVNLVNFHHIRELTVHREAIVYWATVIGVTCVNLLAGVGIGIAISVYYAIKRLSIMQVSKIEEEGVCKVAIRGTLTFACVPKLNLELSSIPMGTQVNIDLDVDFIDHAAFESLNNWRLMHEKTGGKVSIEEDQEQWYKPASEGRPRFIRDV